MHLEKPCLRISNYRGAYRWPRTGFWSSLVGRRILHSTSLLFQNFLKRIYSPFHSQMPNFVKIFEIQVADCTRFLVIFRSQLFCAKYKQKIIGALDFSCSSRLPIHLFVNCNRFHYIIWATYHRRYGLVSEHKKHAAITCTKISRQQNGSWHLLCTKELYGHEHGSNLWK